MTEATGSERCEYVDHGLRCVRAHHPTHPDAHVRVSGSYVPDRHDNEAVAA